MVVRREHHWLIAPVAAEHEALREMVRDIKAELDRLQLDPRSKQCGARLLEDLHRIRERMAVDFARETARWSRSSGRLRDLPTQHWMKTRREQHIDCSRQFDECIQQLEECLEEEGPISSTCEALMRSLLRDLTSRELSDDRLFQRAIFEDMDGI